MTYRIESSPLDMTPLTKVQCIESRPFSPSTIDKLLMQGFHQRSDIAEDGLGVLSSFLSTATKGNPLFVTLLLARLVKDEVLVSVTARSQRRYKLKGSSSCSTLTTRTSRGEPRPRCFPTILPAAP